MYSMDQLVKLINDLWQLCFSFWLPNSGLILQLNSVSITPPVQQLSSTLHVQERHDSPIDDRHKVFMASSNETKSLLSAGGKSLIASLGDNSSTQKVCLPCQLHVLWLMFLCHCCVASYFLSSKCRLWPVLQLCLLLMVSFVPLEELLLLVIFYC